MVRSDPGRVPEGVAHAGVQRDIAGAAGDVLHPFGVPVSAPPIGGNTGLPSRGHRNDNCIRKHGCGSRSGARQMCACAPRRVETRPVARRRDDGPEGAHTGRIPRGRGAGPTLRRGRLATHFPSYDGRRSIASHRPPPTRSTIVSMPGETLSRGVMHRTADCMDRSALEQQAGTHNEMSRVR